MCFLRSRAAYDSWPITWLTSFVPNWRSWITQHNTLFLRLQPVASSWWPWWSQCRPERNDSTCVASASRSGQLSSVVNAQQFTDQYAPAPMVFVLACSRERLNNPTLLRVWNMTPSSPGKRGREELKKMPKQRRGQDAALFASFANSECFRHELGACLHVFVERYVETNVSRQPNSLSMLYKLDRLTVSKASVSSMKTTYSGWDCSTLFSWSWLSKKTMSAVL